MCLGVSRQLQENTLTDQQESAPAPAPVPTLLGSPILLVPRWIQLVSLPVVLLFGWIFAGAVRHALFVFVISGIIAMLLNPLVSALTSLRLPRGLAVLVVYLSLAAGIMGAVGVAGVAAVNQVTSVSNTVSKEFNKQPGQKESSALRRVDRFQSWLDARGLGRVHVKDIGNRLVQNIQKKGVGDYAKRAVDIGQQIASQVVQGLIELLLVIVISIYLLLDAPRISRGLDRVFPPGPDGIHLGPQVQHGLIRYVRGQATVSLLIGASSGIGVEILSLTGVWPDGSQYALILGLWAMATEVIPYVGPILGALPALALAALDSPYTALWVGLFYLGVHQLEGHVIVPRVMGQALGAHPLLVIFALIAGAELYGIIGALLALPTLAMGREIVLFLHRRIQLEPWPATGFAGAGLDVTVPVRIEPEPPQPA
jgi:predicted PurR-regulated permease PerM